MSEITTASCGFLVTVVNSKCLPIYLSLGLCNLCHGFHVAFKFAVKNVPCAPQRLRGSWCQRQWRQVLWRPSPQQPCSWPENYWEKRASLGFIKALVPHCSGKTDLESQVVVLANNCNELGWDHLFYFSLFIGMFHSPSSISPFLPTWIIWAKEV